MKGYLIHTLFFFLATGSCLGQDQSAGDIPDTIRISFFQKYPGAKNVAWEKDNGNYKASWNGKSGESYAVYFTQTGCMVHRVKAIPLHLLPKSALKYLKKKFKDTVATENCEIVDSRGNLFYEVVSNNYDLLFDAKGNFLNRGQ